MKLSIIIRCFNRLEYTIRTIESIDRLSGLNKDDYEIICVDQNSEDGTREWLLSASKEGYYPIVPVLLEENIGDGRGMGEGIEMASGEFIAQHDSDLELVTKDYYEKLICIYKELENKEYKVCALGGSHKQGINLDSAPMRFARKRTRETNVLLTYKSDSGDINGTNLIFTAWVTASFIFRRKFTEEVKFGKGECNSWCGEWFDRGWENFICMNLHFYHIDSGKTGAHVQKQYDKFPSYRYLFRHYSNFITEKGI